MDKLHQLLLLLTKHLHTHTHHMVVLRLCASIWCGIPGAPAASQLSFMVGWFSLSDPLLGFCWGRVAPVRAHAGSPVEIHTWLLGQLLSKTSCEEYCRFCTTEWQLQGYFSALLLHNNPVLPPSSVIFFFLSLSLLDWQSTPHWQPYLELSGE